MVHDVIVCIAQLYLWLDALPIKVATERVPVAQVYIFEAGIEKDFLKFVFYPFGVEQLAKSIVILFPMLVNQW